MVNEQNGSVRVVVPGARPEEFHTLAMSRSIGDKPFHAHGVVATPELRQFDIKATAAPSWLLLCSDGVWEHVDNQEALQVACRANASHDAAKACKALMDYTMDKWAQNNPCYRDDISAVVVDLEGLLNMFNNDRQQAIQSARQRSNRAHRPSR